MKKILAFILILSISLLSLTACSTNTEAQQLTINYIIEQSEYCVVVSTISAQNKETAHKDSFYYTQVNILWGGTDELPEYITIVQENSNYIKKDSIYILFLNKDSINEDNFFTTYGKSGVIQVNGNDIKCLDKSLQRSADKIFGTNLDEFNAWMKSEYYPKEISEKITTEKNVVDLSDYIIATTQSSPVTGLEENVITTAPETQK